MRRPETAPVILWLVRQALFVFLFQSYFCDVSFEERERGKKPIPNNARTTQGGGPDGTESSLVAGLTSILPNTFQAANPDVLSPNKKAWNKKVKPAHRNILRD